MITDRKVKTYIKFQGDDDMWARAASDEDKRALSNDDWHEISIIQMELIQLENELVSQKYKEEIEEHIASLKCSSEVLAELKALK